MIEIRFENPDELRRRIETHINAMISAVEDKVLEKLARDSITSVTSGIDRQQSISGGILKQNSASTVAKKLARKEQFVIGDKGNKYGIRVGKGTKAALGGAGLVRALVDRGVLRKPSTYEYKRINKRLWEVTIRPITSGQPGDTTTRDKVAGYVQDKGYDFFGISKVIQDNVPRIVQNALANLKHEL